MIRQVIKRNSLLLIALCSGTVNAGLLGDAISVTGDDLFGGDFVPTNAIIGDGPEFRFLDDFLFDFDDNSLTISNTLDSAVGWNGYGFATFSGFDALITGFSLSDPTDVSSIGGPLGNDRDILTGYSFSAHSVTLHLGSSTFEPLSKIAFSITSTIPEPATVALMTLGLAGIVISSRKKHPLRNMPL